jgi:hypothetical protein
VVVATQIRMCRIDACSAPIPSELGARGTCLEHYLNEVFTRVSAIQVCVGQGEAPNSRTVTWLRQQGDLAVRLLSGDGGLAQDDRTRLLDLLFCLTNLHESLRLRSKSGRHSSNHRR